MAVAWADSTGVGGDIWPTTGWEGSPQEPSGITYIGNGQYLVVDTNLNDPSGFNGWVMDPDTGEAENVFVDGLDPEDDVTGVHYDAENDRLFVSSDSGWISVVNSYLTGGGSRADINTGAKGSGDTEDPVFDPNGGSTANGILYWVDGAGAEIHWIDPGADGVFQNSDDHGAVPITVGTGDDWEALGRDPNNGNLLLAPREGFDIYEISINPTSSQMSLQGTIDASEISSLGDIAGLGAAAETDVLWVTSRFTHQVAELGYNGTTPTTTTSTTTTTTAPTTTTTTAPTTTTPPTTSTTTPGSTTTTTTPGKTTTTTTPGDTPPTTTPPDPSGEPEPEPGEGGFLDTKGHTFESAIGWLAAEGITQGCNPPDNDEFCPNDKVTRGQMAAFLVRAFEYKDSGAGNYFTDTVGSTFESAIDRLRVAGITQGCNPPTNDEYCPDGFVTRGQMAAFLSRAFEYTDAGTGGYFEDTSENVFRIAIDKLRVAGVTLGCNPPTNDEYCPDDLVTRGQMAAFLKRGFGN
jgi:hypothetical protein